MKFKYLLAAFLLIGAVACSGEKDPDAGHDGYIIKGTTQNFPIGTKVFLQKIKGRQTENLDTASIAEDGTFKMKGKVNKKDFARLMIGRVPSFVILDNHRIMVEVDQNNPRGTRYSGNSEMEALQSWNDRMQNGVPLQKPEVVAFVDSVTSPFVAYTAMQSVQFANGPEIYQAVANRFQKEVPGSSYGKELLQYIASEKSKVAASAKTAVGQKAPPISLPSPDGKTYSLDDLKGKVVLIDFWASWCRPCRAENPKVVKAYKEYKSKGFEVFSVSLDGNSDRWKKAIQDDGLLWDYHVSDLKKWQSGPAADYGVKSIPQTFLIGKDGTIIAKNLRGAALENKLKEVLG